MSFASAARRSSSKHRVVVELDIGIPNEQWVNHGAGVWVANTNNIYAWVDSTLLESGFSAQQFRPIGSVKVDGLPLQQGVSVLDLADTPSAFYYDADAGDIWVTMPNYDEPSIHSVVIGQTYSFSQSDFTPADGVVPVEGRLMRNPSISAERDPLFFGRLVFTSGVITLANGDGEFDRWGIDVDIYGNDVRVFLGFEDESYDDYLRVYTGYMETLTVGERSIRINAIDKRKQLTRRISYSCSNKNALTAIEEILLQGYGYSYDTTFFNTTAWEIARSLVENVTIDTQEPEPVINLIEDIASSVFGLFRVNADNLFTFRVIDETDTIETLIEEFDVLTEHEITYDPTAVVSSVRIGYDRDWEATSDQYTYLTDSSREVSVFGTYKTYNERTFDTVLPTLVAAQAFATRVLNYVDTVRGTEKIRVPLENYAVQLGDQIGVVIQRGNQPMIGEYKAEVIGVSYTLDDPTIELTLRHGTVTEDIRITEDGEYRVTETSDIRMVEQA